MREQGKPIASALAEVRSGSEYVSQLADIRIEDEVLRDSDRQQISLRHRPLGAVAGITAWNYPVQLATSKVAMALATGNTTIIKPSPYTPLTTLRLGELGREEFPPGVFNVLSGLDPLGNDSRASGLGKDWLHGLRTDGQGDNAIRRRTLKRVTLELGGNDAAIVLDDADPQNVAADIFGSALENSGQLCNAIKRLYVHETIYAEVVDELASIARSKQVGDGMDPNTDLGRFKIGPSLNGCWN